MTKPITLQTCVNEAFSNTAFVNEFNRLNKSNLKDSSSINTLIDISTGKKNDDLKKFVEIVDQTIFKPLMEEIMKDIESYTNNPTLKKLQVIKNHGLELYELVDNNWIRAAYLDEDKNKYHFIPLYDDNKDLFALGRYKRLSNN